ncbi:hypothetical protein HIM_08194 [Hirsutella minnesotensis 3608]|uniref:Diphthine methyltransferase n=1 Tax=Hirsutella minnesotensis 3608 TaxID=1043627 RepID=A0A0F7ZHC3_9HYPO|nr:hypothetical protein HIM_08194 [Hirsutella minnesotensis 3608]
MDVQSATPSKASLTLDLPPSCAQFSPVHRAYFVVGTYNLQNDDSGPDCGKSQSRNGSLVVFKVDGDDFHTVQTLLQPSALLDLRFHPCQDKYPGILVAVSSTGTLAVFRLDPTLDSATPLCHLATSNCQDLAEDVLFLQCDWHPNLENAIAVSMSNGVARMLELDAEWKVKQSQDLNVGNSMEAWSIAWSPPTAASEPQGDDVSVSVYCGGDDSSLRYSSCSWGPESSASGCEIPFEAATVKNQHDAGVTAILPLPIHVADGGRLVITGSYDDHLRIFSIHDLDKSHGMKRLRLMGDKNLGGGVWRLNLVDSQQGGDGDDGWRVRILASCMHAGARLVELKGGSEGLHCSCKIVARFEEHKSMNYASDCVAADDAGSLRCVSTSFYDKLLCLWEFRPKVRDDE